MVKKYKIKQGKHSCLHGQWIHYNVKELIIKSIIPYSNKYDLGNDDQLDVNKIGGISFGFDHHENSIRLGWNCINNKLKYYLYLYNNKSRYILDLTDGLWNEEYILHLKLNKLNNSLEYLAYDRSNQIRMEIKYDFNNVLKYGFYLYPYFGGNNAAPKDIINYLEIKTI